QVKGEGGPLWKTATSSGNGMLVHTKGTSAAQRWSGRLTRREGADGACRVGAEWRLETMALEGAGGTRADLAGEIVCVDERPMALVNTDGELAAWLLMADGPVEVIKRGGIGAGWRAMARGSSPGVVTVLWPTGADVDGKGGSGSNDGALEGRTSEPMSLGVLEFFASGRVLYEGRGHPQGPLSAREVRLIAVLLGGVMIAITVFVLKPERALDARVLRLVPAGAMPASVGKRLVATIIDAGAGMIVAKYSIGMEWERAFAMLFVGSAREWAMLGGTALVATWLMSSVGEWLVGRSLGKMLTDCQVISVRGGGAGRVPDGEHGDAPDRGPGRYRVELWQALTRNALKWLPPLSITILLGPRARHFADQVSGTIVVEARPIEPSDGE
ncbi:MAG: RDD family protein, partial [Phycisphaerales bacterium]